MKTGTAKKYSWRAASLLLPLPEVRWVLRTLNYAGKKKMAQVKDLRRRYREEKDLALTFDEAVSASGRTREELTARFRLGKRLWLLLFIPVAIFTLALLFAVLVNATTLDSLILWRAGSMLFALTGFCTLLFSGALKCQLRLWQLQTGHLGTFQEWRATGRWLTSILNW